MVKTSTLLKEIILSYSAVAKKIAAGQLTSKRIDFEHERKSIDELKVKSQQFLNNPTKKSMEEFWNKKYIWSAVRVITAKGLLEKNNLDNIVTIMREINIAKQYNHDWEGKLGARSSLREFWGKIKEQPIENGCADNALAFLGYPGHETYLEFQVSFNDFVKKYRDFIGASAATSYPIEIELDQFFNFLDKANESELIDDEFSQDADLVKLYDDRSKIENQNIIDSQAIRSKISEYLAFRLEGKIKNKSESDYSKWTEEYKWEVLPRVHEAFIRDGVNASNVAEKVAVLQKNNPSSGSFVFWSELDNLKELADKNPALVAELINNLFDEKIPVYKRIDRFNEKVKEYKKDLVFQTSLFGYIMAAYDYNHYPLYKGEVFNYIKKNSGTKEKWKSFSTGLKYHKFTQLCRLMGESLNSNNLLKEVIVNNIPIKTGINALDGQDFFYCVSSMYGNGKEETEDDSKKEKKEKIMDHKNLILYGPPGTGKTYLTKYKALEIINNDSKYCERKDKKQINKEHEELTKKKQIEFITFHPSYSYEDFVEGIRPDLENEGVQIQYRIKDGIFKKMAISAFFECLSIKIGEEEGFRQAVIRFTEEYQAGSILQTVNNKNFSIVDYLDKSIRIQPEGGNNIFSISYKHLEKMYQIWKSVKEIEGPADLAKRMGRLQGLSSYYFSITKILVEYKIIPKGKILSGNDLAYEEKKDYVIRYLSGDNQEITLKDVEKVPKYVLIIDEINRGDISKIFGELITLIEDDKRADQPNRIIAKLPYSEELFCIPTNLYILGTMNTADRSLALIDIALRRRFVFDEILPELDELLKHPKQYDCEKISEEKLFIESVNAVKKINNILADNPDIGRDKKIGHAFFCGLKSKEDIFNIWKNKIMPLLEEYYFFDKNELAKISGDIYTLNNGWNLNDSKCISNLINKLNANNQA